MKDILHCDLNNFFASCEIIVDPDIKDKPVVVGGSEEDRHGVVLAKNYIAKNKGITTGMTIYQAKKLVPDLVIKDTHFDLYNHYSKLVREILLRYTDRVEPFSIDESWLDVTHSKIFGTPTEIADKIREDIKRETGLTASVGVSFNKIFAKLGSDMKKPDATTVITKENYKTIVWRLPVEDLIGIGKHTTQKLKKLGIDSIYRLANADIKLLENVFGKVGKDLYNYANGIGNDDVALYTDFVVPKSVGNSTTFYKDLTDIKDIELGFTVLAENVTERMIKYNLEKARTLCIVVKDRELNVYQKQCKLKVPCRNSQVFTDTALKLFTENYKDIRYVRLLGITVTDFVDGYTDYQLNMFESEPIYNKGKDIDKVVLNIRNKFGHKAIVKANNLYDKKIASTFDDENRKK